MTPALVAAAAAFSGHRFDEATPHLAPDVRWVAVGGSDIAGRDAVIAACRASTAELADVQTEFTRFVVVTGEDAVAVDAVGRYTGADGDVSVVSSCDVYEFADGAIARITSYAVELSS